MRKERKITKSTSKKFKFFKRHNITAEMEHREEWHLLCSDTDLPWIAKSTFHFLSVWFCFKSVWFCFKKQLVSMG